MMLCEIISHVTHRTQSMATISEMSAGGNPTEVRTITMVTRPAWGIPAAPMLAAVAVMLLTREPRCQKCKIHNNVWRRGVSLFSPNSDQLAKVQVILVDLSDKDGCHCLVQSCPVHVDGSSHWQHEASDLPVNSTVLQETLHGDW